jgi:hypothetical protein
MGLMGLMGSKMGALWAPGNQNQNPAAPAQGAERGAGFGVTPAQRRIFVLEVGRPIVEDVKAQLGSVDDVLSIPRAVSELEIPRIAAEAYRRIMRLAQGGVEVHVVLSGPLALAFELGQAIGLAHAKVVVYQFSQGRYVKVPPLTREHLFHAAGEPK